VAVGLAVYDANDGVQERVIPMTHSPGTGAVMPVVFGRMVIEQRDGQITAYGPS
jgi:hypothetical protein